jgi:hypothetical protein
MVADFLISAETRCLFSDSIVGRTVKPSSQSTYKSLNPEFLLITHHTDYCLN